MKFINMWRTYNYVNYVIQNDNDRVTFSKYEDFTKACKLAGIECVPDIPDNVYSIMFSNYFFQPSFIRYDVNGEKLPFSELKVDVNIYIKLINHCQDVLKASYGDLSNEYWIGKDGNQLKANTSIAVNDENCCLPKCTIL